MKIELEKAYEAKKFEDEIYKTWEESGFFNPDNLKNAKKPYCILMPPPNVTGILHLGHALENTLLDSQIRFRRMCGYKALLIPGADHAAVATQARVEKELQKQGIKNPREELGREKLLEKIREYSENSKSTILNQIRKIGTSCDWSRFAYTFDETRSRAVNTLFEKMYNDGLIYRGYRTVNWSVKGQSTCSDDELVYEDEPVTIYTFKYSHDFPIAIATTRPETKLGDTAVAVNPKDDRYSKYIGQKFTMDVGALKPLTITIISDENADINYGTGAVGVTPAHSMVDFEMYQKNKEIGIIPVIGIDGKMTKNAGKNYEGLTVLEAREKFVNWLKENNLIIKQEESTHSVGKSDRFGDVIEVLPMKQWFVDVNKNIPGKNKSLKQLMKDVFTIGHNGNKKKIIKITPDRFLNSYMQWIDNLRDWCISRQIWWGHRIPVWYKNDEVKVSLESPGNNWAQDPDTLDTWFSSGSWTFSTLGWPDKTKDFKTYHPTQWMQMGYEILFFWMARMILMSCYAIDDIPFENVYIHGILRAKDGRKFSKSLGNGLDPIDLINEFGTDALRLSLIKGITPGNDAKFYEEKVVGARNFINKLWNISRYILMSSGHVKLITKEPRAKTLADKWILRKLNSLIESTTEDLKNSEFSIASSALYDFTWTDFADWYVEISKIEKSADAKAMADKEQILLYILQTLLKLWHPFIPFITETIWKNIDSKLLMISSWPKQNKTKKDALIEFGKIQQLITEIRTLKNENKIDLKTIINCHLESAKYEKLINEQKDIIESLAKVKLTNDKYKDTIHIPDIDIYIEIKVDENKKEKQIQELENYIKLLETKLSNKEFSGKAPANIIEIEKKKLQESQELLKKLK